MSRPTQVPQRGNTIVGSGDTSYVSAEMLKQVDTPVETLLGAANGALSGAIISAIVSTVVTAANQQNGKGLMKEAVKNWGGKHAIGMLAGTTALAALGGVVRYSRAVKHNEWSNRHYSYLEHAQPAVTPLAEAHPPVQYVQVVPVPQQVTQPVAPLANGYAGLITNQRAEADAQVQEISR